MKCPFECAELVTLDGIDHECPVCRRVWYKCKVDGEDSLAMRPRRVRLVKPLDAGENINDCIKPV